MEPSALLTTIYMICIGWLCYHVTSIRRDFNKDQVCEDKEQWSTVLAALTSGERQEMMVVLVYTGS